ncbi:MAG: DUF177 domain-containing protein [Ruminococcaceae bacterium]|nr:DUF177 domain-containing protein [Oscillospiraceae bacterium]
MKLDLRPLLAGDRLLSFDYELTLDIDPEDTSSFLYGVSFPSPMKVKGDITNTAGYMRMHLEMSVDYTAECARCLAPVNGKFSLDLEKTVAPKNLLLDLDEDKLDDYAIIEDGFLDMDEQLRSQLEMEFPIRFLCREDCKGLCQRCGKNLNEGECGCSKKEIDPRLAPLQKILDEMKK